MPLDIEAVRAQFPALSRRQAVFLDNPGGTQVVQSSIDRMNAYLVEHNANRHGAFETSRASDILLREARSAMADYFNASRPEEIVFGPNMTSLTFQISRTLAAWLNPGDEIVVTRLDHDANITPWTRVAEDRGCKIRWVDFDVEDGTLRLDDLERALESKPRLLAVGYASNALGTINPVRKIIEMAHAVRALVYVDAVQYVPHGPVDVQDLGCDFLAASAYKFFGPHIGVLFGRYDLLDELSAYRVRPAPSDPPGKFETGTQNHEGIAGLLGALEYLESLGRAHGTVYADKYGGRFTGRALRLKQAMAAIRAYEFELSRALLQVLEDTPGVQLYGPQDPKKLDARVPTFAFNLSGWQPRHLAEALGEQGFYVWDGNYYALAVTERLGVENTGGMVRVGPVHYNTVEELQSFGETLAQIASS